MRAARLSFVPVFGSARVPLRGLCGRPGTRGGRLREAVGPRRGGAGGSERRGAAVGPEPRRAEMRQCPLRAGCRRSLRGREPSRALGDRREALRASAGRLP